ncbi:PREDICTED: GPI mannosyltransferase 2-like, partial [Rhagoletis zephyria]|uniref:GPI mannosyltransferase 2-like n=1 Tax=Rhagoletis zephyria TaxID=28612 RepID=UPI0008115462
MDFQVVRLCLFTRLGVTLLAVAANFLPDHESADAFRNDLLARYPVDQRSTLDRAILWWAEPLTRWDAQYFLEIAHENGYREEQTLAFFPMFPLLVRYVGLGLQRAILFHFPTAQLSFISSLMLAAYLVNLVAFTLAGWFLYQLTYTVSHSRAQSYRAVKIFAFNPASIFFTAYYTESLFSCLTFGSLYFLYHYNLSVVSSVLIALSAYTRSNGVVTFPFIAFSNLIHMLSMAKGARASPAYLSLRFFTVTALEALICLIPPVLFQWSAWVQFCRDTTTTSSSSSSPKPVWCQGDTFSLPYSYVQGTYWENGFLRYYQLKKIPNFLMAAPTLLLVITSTLLYLRRHRHHLLALLVDHFSPSYNPQLSITALTEHSAYVVQHQPQPQTQPQQQPQQQSQPPAKPQEYKRNDLFQQPCLLPFALHALFLATFCLLFMHVE